MAIPYLVNIPDGQGGYNTLAAIQGESAYQAAVKGGYTDTQANFYTDLATMSDIKAHAFNDLATVQGTETDKAPTNKLLKESTFTRVYREATDLTGITYPVTIGALTKAIIDANLVNCMFVIGMNAATETKVTGLPTVGTTPQTFGTLTIIIGSSALRMRIEYNKEIGNDSALMWVGSLNRSVTPYTVTWDKILTDKVISTVMPLSSAAASNDKVLGEKVVYDEFAARTPKRLYNSLTDLGLTSTATPENVGAAMIDNSIVELDVTSSTAPNIVPSYVGGQGCIVIFKRKTVNVISVVLQTKSANTTNSYHLTGSIRNNDSSNKWSGWKQSAFTDNPTFTGTVTAPTQMYADNAAAIAGGMTVGQMYRTSTGQLMIVY